MTKTLTEQWKDGELDGGYYYYKTESDKIVLGFQYPLLQYPYDCHHNTIDDIKEVLAPVPSYDELQTKDMLLDSYKKENKRLKAVAKHCENVAGKWADKLFDTEKKMECIEKQLEIATKALKGVSLWANSGNGGEKAVKKVCEQALKEMEGVK